MSESDTGAVPLNSLLIFLQIRRRLRICGMDQVSGKSASACRFDGLPSLKFDSAVGFAAPLWGTPPVALNCGKLALKICKGKNKGKTVLKKGKKKPRSP